MPVCESDCNIRIKCSKEKIQLTQYGYKGYRFIKQRTNTIQYTDFSQITMSDWEKRLNSFIEMFEYGVLQDAGKVTAEIAKMHEETEFEKYRVIQDKLFMSDYDKYLLELEEHIEG